MTPAAAGPSSPAAAMEQGSRLGQAGIVRTRSVRVAARNKPGTWLHSVVQNPQNHDFSAEIRPIRDREIENVGGAPFSSARDGAVERAHAGCEVGPVLGRGAFR